MLYWLHHFYRFTGSTGFFWFNFYLISWLYLDRRSDLHGAPVLIWGTEQGLSTYHPSVIHDPSITNQPFSNIHHPTPHADGWKPISVHWSSINHPWCILHHPSLPRPPSASRRPPPPTWPVQSPTTRSEMNVSSVSPERWLTITPQPLLWASLHLHTSHAHTHTHTVPHAGTRTHTKTHTYTHAHTHYKPNITDQRLNIEDSRIQTTDYRRQTTE